MDFKDDIAADLNNVFYNNEEFSEVLTFGSQQIRGIFSKLTKDSEFFDSTVEDEINISKDSKILSVIKSELTTVPIEGTVVDINSVEYRIIKIAESNGKFDMFISRMED